MKENVLLTTVITTQASNRGGPLEAVFHIERLGGIHLFDEGFIFEIIDPETLNPLGPGEEGELVITSLKKEAATAM